MIRIAALRVAIAITDLVPVSAFTLRRTIHTRITITIVPVAPGVSLVCHGDLGLFFLASCCFKLLTKTYHRDKPATRRKLRHHDGDSLSTPLDLSISRS
ncbi:hypothetical protein F2Q69_00008172 [Brassica cretica]|uniref:Uncharacterized protein n=1 Tax=Brassica cretica TaxID=69181 RepID=A0A8S9P162_BRACR|nr:hypothetical protein F2Q69_00008172 [Brassica cretica]